MAAHFN